LDKLSKSNKKVDKRIKEITKAIVNIEAEGKSVLQSTVQLAEISKEFSSGTQQAAAETEEQYAVMEGIKSDIASVKHRMEQLESMVKMFKI
jgi:methyl-accepting chemotaxis protein